MGVNIIGLNFEDFKQLFHHPKSYGVDKYYLSNESYPTYVYEFDEIGVQAWEAKGKNCYYHCRGQRQLFDRTLLR